MSESEKKTYEAPSFESHAPLDTVGQSYPFSFTFFYTVVFYYF